ncbi:MAG: hypothetical protein JWN44_2960, partial [Myxococcales bacterium]|nr:hypothetical protein [Myxococcales bacterium]
MSSLRPGMVSGLAFALFSTVAGCASTYAPPGLPPPRDFGVDDLAGSGTGGNGGEDLAVASGSDLAAGGGSDLAMARDLATPRDLAQACLIDDADGFAARALFVAAPTAGGIFAARFGAGGAGGG